MNLVGPNHVVHLPRPVEHRKARTQIMFFEMLDLNETHASRGVGVSHNISVAVVDPISY